MKCANPKCNHTVTGKAKTCSAKCRVALSRSKGKAKKDKYVKIRNGKAPGKKEKIKITVTGGRVYMNGGLLQEDTSGNFDVTDEVLQLIIKAEEAEFLRLGVCKYDSLPIRSGGKTPVCEGCYKSGYR